jgi:hypothetical protein
MNSVRPSMPCLETLRLRPRGLLVPHDSEPSRPRPGQIADSCDLRASGVASPRRTTQAGVAHESRRPDFLEVDRRRFHSPVSLPNLRAVIRRSRPGRASAHGNTSPGGYRYSCCGLPNRGAERAGWTADDPAHKLRPACSHRQRHTIVDPAPDARDSRLRHGRGR